MGALTLWFFLFAVFLVLEVFTTGFVCIFFSLGALGACLTAWLGFALTAQLACFSLLSVGSLLFLRRHLREMFSGRTGKSVMSTSPVLHQQGVVVRATSPTVPGEISLGGSFWRAVSAEPLPPDTTVRVVGTDSHNELILHVEKADAGLVR